MNTLKSENVQLKGKLLQGEKVIAKKDKTIKNLLNRISTPSPGSYGAAKASVFRKDGDNSLLTGLKRKIVELKKKNRTLKESVDSLRRALKVTSAQELRAEVKAYSKECVRLRKIIDELTHKNPQVALNGTGHKLHEQTKLIIRIKAENKGLLDKIKKLSKRADEWKAKVEPNFHEVQKLKTQLKNTNFIKNVRKEKLESEKQEREYERIIRNLELQLSNKHSARFNPSPNTKTNNEDIDLSALGLKLSLIMIEKPVESLKDLLFKNFNDNDRISIHELSRILARSPIFLKPEDSLKISRYVIEPKDTVECNELLEEQFPAILRRIREMIPEYTLGCSKDIEGVQKTLLDKVKEKLGVLPEALQEVSDENGCVTVEGLKKACDSLKLELSGDETDYILLTMYKERRDVRELHYENFIDHLGKLLTEMGFYTESDEHRESQNDYSPSSEEAKNKQMLSESELNEEQTITIVQKCFTTIAETVLGQGIKIEALFKGETRKREVNGESVELVLPETFFGKMKEVGVHEFSSVEKQCISKLLAANETEKGFRISDLTKIMDDYNALDTEENITKEMRFEELDKVSMVILLALTEYMIGSKISLYDLFGPAIHKQPVQIDDAEIELDIINSSDFFSTLNSIGIEISETENENLHRFLCIDPKYTGKFSLDKLKVAIEEFGTNKELRIHARQCYQDLVDEEQLQEESKKEYSKPLINRKKNANNGAEQDKSPENDLEHAIL
eukprot:TRINITY_DN6724_c0_g3_i1.p1 TRINITY_DN6724_c0_g3~~TRINITY_DN6724_c0_g3_i1.p1  ORF type:complete len:735 (+),score=247.57 TRINITY_DN6724_c0_g3_i1:360-2564(+)